MKKVVLLMVSTLICAIFGILFGIRILINVIFPDEKLTLQRENYADNELSIDGYYYTYFGDNDITAIIFFFRNGVVRSGSSYRRFFEDNKEEQMVSHYNKFTPKSDWGVFIVNDNTLQYERWVGSSSSQPKVYLIRKSGIILNDTTFHFTEEYWSERKETRQIDEVWHFKHFSPKPDSTNVYIK